MTRPPSRTFEIIWTLEVKCGNVFGLGEHMEGQYLRCICRACLLFLLALIAVSPTIAQQGQYKLNNLPFSLSGMTSQGGIATYSPIKTVTGESILLKDDDGNVFTFTLDANTVFCQGDTKVSDWSYLKKVLKKASVTVLTNDFTDKKALVIWDRAPKISKVDKEIVFDLPPMCK